METKSAWKLPAACLFLLLLAAMRPALAGYGISSEASAFVFPPSSGGTIAFQLDNTEKTPLTFHLDLSGDALPLVSMDSQKIVLQPNSYKDLLVRVSPPQSPDPAKNYFLIVTVSTDASSGTLQAGGAGFEQKLVSTYTIRFAAPPAPEKVGPAAALPPQAAPGNGSLALAGGAAAILLAIACTAFLMGWAGKKKAAPVPAPSAGAKKARAATGAKRKRLPADRRSGRKKV